MTHRPRKRVIIEEDTDEQPKSQDKVEATFGPMTIDKLVTAPKLPEMVYRSITEHNQNRALNDIANGSNAHRVVISEKPMLTLAQFGAWLGEFLLRNGRVHTEQIKDGHAIKLVVASGWMGKVCTAAYKITDDDEYLQSIIIPALIVNFAHEVGYHSHREQYLPSVPQPATSPSPVSPPIIARDSFSRLGVPPNIMNIAVTEAMNSVLRTMPTKEFIKRMGSVS